MSFVPSENTDSGTVTARDGATVGGAHSAERLHDAKPSKGPTFATCDETGCSAAAIRGNFCVEHARACNSCGGFYGVAELVGGECAPCRKADCGYALERFIGSECWCGLHQRRG